ncbi:unnamed protein product, partial [Phaeothamnion confervicola]
MLPSNGVKGKKQRCWRFWLTGMRDQQVSETDLLAAFRVRYTTIVEVALEPSGPEAPVVVRIQFKGPQPSEGPVALLRELYGATRIDVAPVELARGRRKRPRVGAGAVGANGGGGGVAPSTADPTYSDSETSEYALGETACDSKEANDDDDDYEEDGQSGCGGGGADGSYSGSGSNGGGDGGYHGQQQTQPPAASGSGTYRETSNGAVTATAALRASGGGAATAAHGTPHLWVDGMDPLLMHGGPSLDVGIPEEMEGDLSPPHGSPRLRRLLQGAGADATGFNFGHGSGSLGRHAPTQSSGAASAAAGAVATAGGTQPLPPPEMRVRCEPKECSFGGVPATGEASSGLLFHWQPHELSGLHGRSLLVYFGVDAAHHSSRRTAALRVETDGCAVAAVEFPSMEEIWPELFAVENVRLVLVDVAIFFDDGSGRVVGPSAEMQLTYHRPLPPDIAEAASAAAFGGLRDAPIGSSDGSGVWARTGLAGATSGWHSGG